MTANWTACGLKCASERGALSWVIVGGESGRNARSFPMEAGLDLLRQCRAAGVAAFFKQTGEKPYDGAGPWLVTGKGGEPKEWPPEFRVREFPGVPHGR